MKIASWDSTHDTICNIYIYIDTDIYNNNIKSLRKTVLPLCMAIFLYGTSQIILENVGHLNVS